MGQLNFAYNLEGPTSQLFAINNGTLSFFPFNLYESLSFSVVNFPVQGENANRTVSYSLGLYSLTGSSISLANSISGTRTQNNTEAYYVSLTATSAAQNITPGTWWFGFLASTGGNANVSLLGQSNVIPGNSFPGSFIQGRMTDSTNALPGSYATSDLDTTGADAMNIPMILLST